MSGNSPFDVHVIENVAYSDLSLMILKKMPKMNLKYSYVILTKLLLKVGFSHGNLPKYRFHRENIE